MTLLITGFLLFVGIHAVSIVNRAWRDRAMTMANLSPRARLRLCLLITAAASAPLLAQPNSDQRPAAQLNSERIEQRFGSYGIEVLSSANTLRVANLYSTEGEDRVCRTFAVTRYPDPVDSAYAAEHREILAGGSIGAVFAARGWQVSRRHLWFGEVPPSAYVLALMGDAPPVPLAAHLFELVVTRDGESFTYATIAEVHHADYLVLRDLSVIFGDAWREGIDVEATASMLTLTLQAMQ